MFIKILPKDGESADKFIKRFSSHIKTTGIAKAFRNGRYFKQKPTKVKVRSAAISREKYRAAAKKRQFLSQ